MDYVCIEVYMIGQTPVYRNITEPGCKQDLFEQHVVEMIAAQHEIGKSQPNAESDKQ